jgi:hypothetical protein
MHTPSVEQWSFTVERGITKNLALQLGYVGSEAHHTLLPMNLNAPRPQTCTIPTDLEDARAEGSEDRWLMCPPGTTYIPPSPLRPKPYMDKTNSQMFAGTSSHHALNVSLVKRATRGLIFKTNYTFSKVLDYNSGGLLFVQHQSAEVDFGSFRSEAQQGHRRLQSPTPVQRQLRL